MKSRWVVSGCRVTVACALLAGWGMLGCGRSSSTDGAEASVPGVHPVALHAANFEAEVLNSSVPVVVDFWAAWCGPCRRIAPTLEKLTAEFDGRIKICKLNVDEESELAGRYGIEAIPALLAFKDGEVVDERIGSAGEREYREWFESLQ